MNPTKKTLLIIGIATALAAPAFAHGHKGKGQEEKVDWNNVPAAVQTTITSHASGGQVVSVEKENEHGVMQYEAKVKGTDGKMSEIKVGEDGKFLKMKACNEKGHGKHEGKGHDDDDDKD
jgi:hypothetical protein